MRILIADDHPIVRRGLRALVEAQPGWRICAEAGDGAEALQRALEQQPDVAVLDSVMPKMGGLETARMLAGRTPGPEVILFGTEVPELAHARTAGAPIRGYVLKSDPVVVLVEALHTVGRHQDFVTPPVAAYEPSAPLTPPPGVQLTRREREIVQLIAEGRRTREIAALLDITEKTVETHRGAVLRKLGARSVMDVVRYAIRQHLVEP